MCVTLNEKLTVSMLALQSVLLGFQLWLIYRQLVLGDRAERRAQTHDKLSVTPALDFVVNSRNDLLTFELRNYGIGPARLTGLEYFVDDVAFTHRVPGQPTISLFCLTLSVPWGTASFMNEIARDSWLAVGGSINLIILTGFPTTAAAIKCRDRIGVRVQYESMYGDRNIAFVGAIGSTQ
jgi:hypothetical protein